MGIVGEYHRPRLVDAALSKERERRLRRSKAGFVAEGLHRGSILIDGRQDDTISIAVRLEN
jgi:hypothetical protein